ncbi:hypothetical protein EVAR_39408_1 [Eumeta japonica]|uniref:Uncharacterized protein n=1 Tax=Eumeta variegata TaxID=151549 RepID=A0A4C1YWQ3_EUMVA|nr:hypothetical protein EVAR_39408_1 [Eumeta japonica]
MGECVFAEGKLEVQSKLKILAPTEAHRIRFERDSQEQSRGTYKTLHDCRKHRRVKIYEWINDGASTPAAGRSRLCKWMMYSLLHRR